MTTRPATSARNLQPTRFKGRCLGQLVLLLVAVSAGVLSAARVDGAEPSITRLSVRGLSTGATTTIVVGGANLLPQPRVVLPVPIAKQEVKPGGTPNQVTIQVTLDPGVPSGIYHMWLATADGISAPTAVALDPLSERAFSQEIDALPVALNAALQGSDVLRTSFHGSKDQRVVIDVESRRLGSKLSPVLHLYDERGVQLAWSQPSSTLFGDARISTVLPAGGRYTIELHDLLYRGAAPGFFRLKIGNLQFVDLVFPLGVKRGTTSPLELIPAPTIATNSLPAGGELPVSWLAPVGAGPRVICSDLDEVLENPAGETPGPITAPVSINGRLARPGEEDRYSLAVTPGQKLRFDLLSHRIGTPLDGVLTLYNEDGGRLASNDDRPGTSDPGLDYTVPGGMKKLVVALADLQAGGGPYYIYRLAVTDLGKPDFGLTVFSDHLALPESAATIVRVRATRRGYNGPIKLSLSDLPEGVACSGLEIPAGATDTLLALGFDGKSSAAAVVSITGQSVGLDPPLRRWALNEERATSQYQPWLKRQIATAATGAPPVSIAWEPASGDGALPLGGDLAARVRIARSQGTEGPVRFSLLTSQIAPTKVIPGKVVGGNRTEPDQTVDDQQRTLRLEGESIIAADQSSTQLKLLVPGDLPDVPYDVALQAELLSADGKTVLATGYTPVWRLRTTQPFRLELAGQTQVDAKAGSGETGQLVGKINRNEGFDHPVTLALAGLPAELPVPMIEVPANQTEFTLPVAFPYPTKLGKLSGVQLIGTSQISPKIMVRSTGTPVAINVVRGGPPPDLLPLFEDDARLVSYLSEGDGKITLDSEDRYSGSGALRVTPQQSRRARLPGVSGIKITKDPGDGEYRYLRFAWKKSDGVAILLQLLSPNYQPEGRVTTRPAIAYESGGGSNVLRIPARRLSEELPTDWVVITRDLYTDFGEFTLEGLALVPGDGKYGLFDHIYLAKSEKDFAGCGQPAAGLQGPNLGQQAR